MEVGRPRILTVTCLSVYAETRVADLQRNRIEETGTSALHNVRAGEW